jgi:hypothetical protein
LRPVSLHELYLINSASIDNINKKLQKQ